MGGSPQNHHFFSSVELIIGACFAGYTVTHLPADFLKLFERPYVQFVVFYVLFNTSHGGSVSQMWVIADALLFTALMNLGIYVIKRAYGENFESTPQCCLPLNATEPVEGECGDKHPDGEPVDCE
jgi:hypothetical protein